MLTDSLPEFQEFLLSHQLVSEKNIPFYALWVSKFISFMNGNPDIPNDSALLAFLERLPKQKKIEDWQLQQAEEAVKFYLGHFLKAEKQGAIDRPIRITNISQILDDMRRLLRLKHYSYSTEKTFIDWAKRFFGIWLMRRRTLWTCSMPANESLRPGQNIRNYSPTIKTINRRASCRHWMFFVIRLCPCSMIISGQRADN